MSHHFVQIMEQILREANAGAFATKEQVITRRSELVGEKKGNVSEPADTAQASEGEYTESSRNLLLT